MSGEGPTYDIMVVWRIQKKKLSINFSKEKTRVCLILHYNGESSYLFANGEKCMSVKPVIKM